MTAQRLAPPIELEDVLEAVDASARAARSGSPTYHHHSEDDPLMTAKKVYDIGALEPGTAQRIRLPEGGDQTKMIGRARAAVTAWRRRAIDEARTKKAAREIEARRFEVLASGKGHIRIKRVDAGEAVAAAAEEKPSVRRVASRAAKKPANARKKAASAA